MSRTMPLRMQPASFFVLLCILKCIGVVFAVCTVSKHEEGHGDRLQCSNASLETILSQTSTDVSAIMILQSNLKSIPQRAFRKYSNTLESLNIHKCRVTDIDPQAFDTLSKLKKLGLPNNGITRVKEEWFKDLVYLEQLDLSFNRITSIESRIFGKLMLLKRLDIRENRITCLEPSFPGGIHKLYFSGNPVTFTCRGKLTRWLRDHGVSYEADQSERETWLDNLLWLCAIGDPDLGKSEVLMKECVVLNLFNQLRTGLTTAESYPLTVRQECVDARVLLTSCIAAEAQKEQAFTNGNMIVKLLLYLRQTKMTV